MAFFGLFGRYEVVRGASSQPDWRSPRHTSLDSAKARADQVDGYVRLAGTWTVVHISPGYRGKFPFGQGGHGQPEGDPVIPNWTQRGAELDAAEASDG